MSKAIWQFFYFFFSCIFFCAKSQIFMKKKLAWLNKVMNYFYCGFYGSTYLPYFPFISYVLRYLLAMEIVLCWMGERLILGIDNYGLDLVKDILWFWGRFWLINLKFLFSFVTVFLNSKFSSQTPTSCSTIPV